MSCEAGRVRATRGTPAWPSSAVLWASSSPATTAPSAAPAPCELPHIGGRISRVLACYRRPGGICAHLRILCQRVRRSRACVVVVAARACPANRGPRRHPPSGGTSSSRGVGEVPRGIAHFDAGTRAAAYVTGPVRTGRGEFVISRAQGCRTGSSRTPAPPAGRSQALHLQDVVGVGCSAQHSGRLGWDDRGSRRLLSGRRPSLTVPLPIRARRRRALRPPRPGPRPASCSPSPRDR